MNLGDLRAMAETLSVEGHESLQKAKLIDAILGADGFDGRRVYLHQFQYGR